MSAIENKIACSMCGEILYEDGIEVNSDWICDDCLNNYFVCCSRCGETVHEDNADWVNGDPICNDCAETYCVTCAECGELFYEEEAVWADHEQYCHDCSDRVLVRCECCNELFHQDSSRINYDGNIFLCNDCFHEDYYECSTCGTFIYADYAIFVDDVPYCSRDCVPSRFIEDYCYKPSPLFHGEGPLFMGIELEIDGGGEEDENAQEIVESLGELVYCKHDSSLDRGFEIVTHPMDLDFFYSKLPNFRTAFETAMNLGYSSHDAETCGLHIHVSRNVLEEEDIAKIIYINERLWPKLVVFSRRTHEQIRKYAYRYLDEETHDDIDILQLFAEAKYKSNRYFAINITPAHTIEFRIFRGTLNYKTFAATVEFVHFIVGFAKKLSLEDMQKLTWKMLTDAVLQADYKYLPAYLEKRDLIPKNIAKNTTEERSIA